MAAETPNEITIIKPSVYLQDMKEVQHVFERFDADKDGKISSEDMAFVMKAIGSVTSEEEISSMMREIDADEDGYINLAEFASFCKGDSIYGRADGGDGGVKEIHDAFELYDQDRDGYISATDLHQILTRLGERRSVHDCANIIRAVDSDGDGKVCFEEFRQMMTSSSKKDS